MPRIALGVCLFMTFAECAFAQRPRNANRPNSAPDQSDAPTTTGKVVAYEQDKSITLERTTRNGVQRSEFTIVKDQTKIELLPRMKDISVGATLSVWVAKDDPKVAVRIGMGNASPAGMRRPGNRRPNLPPTPANRNPAEAAVASVLPLKPKRPSVVGLSPQSVAAKIDEYVQLRLNAEKIPSSPICDDAEFIRRVYLDITGVIPSAEKVTDFLDSDEPEKRAKLIEELLTSPVFGVHFADVWCDRVNVKDLPIYRQPFVDWLSGSLNAGCGWDEIVFELLTAGGRFNFITRGKRLGSEAPQALFVLLNTEEGMGKGPNPAWLAGESGRLFLGIQLQCAECHDHPFTSTWKQTDFWGLAAFFGELHSENRGPGGLHWVEKPTSADRPDISIPATALKNVGQTVPARLPGVDQDYQAVDRQLLRYTVARWITSSDNDFFAKAAANRMWADFFGQGLVAPVDDLRPDNPPSHPEVLQLLADEFAKSQFDLRHLIRCLCLSATYQRTAMPLADNEQDHSLYSHRAIKTMTPGVFYDSLKVATGWPELKVGIPERKTKLTVMSLFTPREVFVDFFRSSQGTEANPLDNDHGIPQALKLMNSAQLNSVAPFVERLSAAAHSRDQVIEQLYLATLTRRPTSAESALAADFLEQRKNDSERSNYCALLWVLINSAEFVSIR